jgi:hypothetical protein
VIGFAAGFSERWAQDTLTGGLTGRGAAKDDASAGKRRAAKAPPPRHAPIGSDTDLVAD